MKSLSINKLKELLTYDSLTGIFTRKNGKVAGSLNNGGYIVICVDGSPHYAHRLAWLYMTGEWPKDHTDHINGIRNDNRFVNLRAVTCSANLQNQKKARIDNKLNLLGVSVKRKGFRATIRISGIQTYLGAFKTPELAHAAYLTAKRQHHEGCTI